ncbi:MAG: hypothetical protein IKR81_04030 [Victivallales bacterium]|nr:hypothetical protein [Victivallales bacterium]
MTISYSSLEQMDWWEVNEVLHGEAKLPRSVHVPLNYPGAKVLTFCDCALNAYCLPSPALNTSLPQDRAVRDMQHVKIVSFAFGETPYVPEFRLVKLTRRIGGLPIIRAEFSAWNLLYLLDYCMAPDGVLHIHATVRNEAPVARKAVVWMRPSHPLEKELFAYHYVPFNWDASNWLPDNSFKMIANNLYSEDGLCGRLAPGGFESSWVEQADFTGETPNQFFGCGTPYWVYPQYQLKSVTNAIRLETELSPKAEACFEFAIEFEAAPATPDVLAILYQKAETAAAKKWRSILKGLPEIELGSERENTFVEAVRLNNLQLLLEHDGMLRPCQGGSSERFYVWVWEAMCSLRPMLHLGHFKEVRKVIEFIFTLQDGGCPPIGNFTTTAGAIGTSGPKWANTTGAALALAADYLLFSGDKSFAKEYLEKMLRAADWIVGEIRATRIKGSSTYGVMPLARSTDGDVGQVIFTDAWSLCGLMRLCTLLKQTKHPKAKYYCGECEQYKHDLDAVLESIRQSDGFIPRSYGADSSQVCHNFRFTCTPLECCAAGILPATDAKMRDYQAWLEAHAYEWLFCSPVTHGIFYIGNNELTVMKMFMEQGRAKAAWAAAQVFRRFAVTPDLFLTQERYSQADERFTAWQPNASNNGRILEMEMARFFYEAPDGSIILCGGIAPFERKHELALKGFYTQFGKCSVICDEKRILLQTERPLPCGMTIIAAGKTLMLDKVVKNLEIKL